MAAAAAPALTNRPNQRKSDPIQACWDNFFKRDADCETLFILLLLFVAAGLISIVIGQTYEPGEHEWNPPKPGSVCRVVGLTRKEYIYSQILIVNAQFYPTLAKLEEDKDNWKLYHPPLNSKELGESWKLENWKLDEEHKPPEPSKSLNPFHCEEHTEEEKRGRQILTWSWECPSDKPCYNIYIGSTFDCNKEDTQPTFRSKTRIQKEYWHKPGVGEGYTVGGALVVLLAGIALVFVSIGFCCACIF